MSFFDALVTSVYRIPLLATRRHATSKALSYMVMFVLVAAVVKLFPLMWQIPQAVSELRGAVMREMPAFQATVHNGELSVTGIEQPFVRTYDDGGNDNFTFVVDTVSTTTPTIDAYVTSTTVMAVLVTKTGLTAYDANNQQTRTVNFKQTEASFSNETIAHAIERFAGFTSYIIAPFIIVAIFIFWTIGKLIYVALFSLLVFFVASVAKRVWTYSEVFTVGLYAITIPTLVQVLMAWTGFEVPFVYTIIFLAVMFYVVFAVPATMLPPSAPPAEPPQV